jgi:hypothetical protein
MKASDRHSVEAAVSAARKSKLFAFQPIQRRLAIATSLCRGASALAHPASSIEHPAVLSANPINSRKEETHEKDTV